MRIVTLTLALVLGCAGVAAAQSPDGALLARLIASGDHGGARAQLAASFSDPAVHALHRTHLEGLIAHQQGRTDDAIGYFRAALVVDPGFIAARLQLARVLMQSRNFEAAQHHLEILALDNNPTIRSIAQAGLGHIIANRGYGASLHASFAPSSNLNRGSAHKTFAAGGLAFSIDPDSRQTAGTGVTIGGDAYNTFTLNNGQTIVASAGADLTTDIEGTRAEQLSLNAGLSWQGGVGASRFAFGPIVDLTYSAFEPHLLRYGLSGKLEMPAGAQNLVGLSFTALAQDYASQTFRNGFRVRANGQLTHAVTPALRASIQLGVDAERTQSPHLDYDSASAEVRIVTDWRGGFSSSVFMRYDLYQYLGNFPGTGMPRVDDRVSTGVTVSNSQIDLGGFTPTLTYTYTRQFSNVSFFDFDSHDISVGLTKGF